MVVSLLFIVSIVIIEGGVLRFIRFFGDVVFGSSRSGYFYFYFVDEE